MGHGGLVQNLKVDNKRGSRGNLWAENTQTNIFLGHPNDFACKTNRLFSFVSHDGPKLSFELTSSFIGL